MLSSRRMNTKPNPDGAVERLGAIGRCGALQRALRCSDIPGADPSMNRWPPPRQPWRARFSRYVPAFRLSTVTEYPMRYQMRSIAMPPAFSVALMTGTILLAGTLHAATTEPQPEVKRSSAVAPPQAIGAVHTVRQIPEACARIEGAFTGQAAEPYRFALVRTSPQCQPRARMVDFAKAQPSEATGWKFNDLVRIPSAACPSQQAVVRVWRKPVDNTVAKDGQGQARVYLEEAKQQAAAGKIAQAKIPLYAAEMTVEGKACP